jgi:hypothetical protein
VLASLNLGQMVNVFAGSCTLILMSDYQTISMAVTITASVLAVVATLGCVGIYGGIGEQLESVEGLYCRMC